MGYKGNTPYDMLLETISTAWLTMKQRFRSKLAELNLDLTFEQILVLHILYDKEGQNLGALAERADRERTTMSRMVDGLERRNLVVRVPDKTDKRNKLLYLTKFGKQRIEELEPLGLEFFRNELFKGISEDEVNECRKLLQRIIDNINHE